MRRKYPLETGNIYHVLNKSIAGFKIFLVEKDFSRMLSAVKYYQLKNAPFSFSRLARAKKNPKDLANEKINKFLNNNTDKLVEIIAYCLMPTHIHLILRQVKDEGISIFMNRILGSYTRYFNLFYKRKGPLWEGRFKNVLVESQEQLYHLTRYIHLNPVTAYLADSPKDWPFSSYREYLKSSQDSICKYDNIFEINPSSYKEFVENRASDQRKLAKLKKLTLD